ncbi:MAG: hypothetical protein LAT57_12030 [Balneolales bacterium]|nr:hypothetical protein [Balneolales bacterium]
MAFSSTNLLLADSGSTKTEWCLVKSDGTTITAFTGGLNPYYHTEESIEEILRNTLIPEIGVDSVDAVYFYGAGCTGDERTEMLAGVLKSVFNAEEVEVQSDILGSVRAVCGRKPGIAGILGTGANSCQYDGEKVVDNVPVLGFILGDEGSAGYFGRKILQGYFYREMPEDLKTALETEFDMRRATILENVYQKPQPNTYVAGFAKFAGDHADHPYIKTILRDGLVESVERHILKYNGAKTMPVGFVGSVAFYNSDLLREILVEKGLIPGEIIKNPMPNLVKYHKAGSVPAHA